MDAAYISAFAALAGSIVGGLTSLAASWLSQHVQFAAEQRAKDLGRREELYRSFMEEAAKLYADAFEHEAPQVSSLVNLYSLISRMRMLSSPKIIENADKVVRVIVETYLAPNKTFRDVKDVLDNEDLNPLREFTLACREEVRGYD
jgi:hypothetical protein